MRAATEGSAILIPGLGDGEVAAVEAELRRRFRGLGCLARTADFARLFPSQPHQAVEEALHRLCDHGVAEMDCLADGSLAFYFPRH